MKRHFKRPSLLQQLASDCLVTQKPSLMSFLLIEVWPSPSLGPISEWGPHRLMCFSCRFIFALMPLCSVLYWCFCHVVKIYGAISLAWNELIQTSALADLWPTATLSGGKNTEKPSHVFPFFSAVKEHFRCTFWFQGNKMTK